VKGLKVTDRFLRLPEVKDTVGLSRSTIYQHIEDGTFPKPISLGARAVGWLQSDIEKWVQNRVESGADELGSWCSHQTSAWRDSVVTRHIILPNRFRHLLRNCAFR
jgi:prophage regulatory protein